MKLPSVQITNKLLNACYPIWQLIKRFKDMIRVSTLIRIKLPFRVKRMRSKLKIKEHWVDSQGVISLNLEASIWMSDAFYVLIKIILLLWTSATRLEM